ncbi:MAG: DUF1553 domain-containing protein [Planctomycetota bacterium]|nr:MAG: DUF1553 domain-containing protein [Planctomycetota bacterium]
MHDGWSLKRLHRLIVTSRTYCLASSLPDAQDEANADVSAPPQRGADNRRFDQPYPGRSVVRPQSPPSGTTATFDPENRLWWRAERRRLEFEPLRDALLQVSGLLDRRMGGRPVDLFAASAPPRRTIYGFVDRYNVPPLLRFFDVADPDSSTARRSQTIVPQQALFMMNSELLYRTADATVRQVLASRRSAAPGHPDSRAPSAAAKARTVARTSPAPPSGNGSQIDRHVRSLFRRTLARDPTAAERRLAKQFLLAGRPPARHPARRHRPPEHRSPQTSSGSAALPARASGPEPGSRQATPRHSAPIPPERWRLLAQTLLMSNEFAFID